MILMKILMTTVKERGVHRQILTINDKIDECNDDDDDDDDENKQ